MGSFNASLPGLKELDQKLSALKGKTANRLIRDAVMAGGKVFQAEVRLRAPVRASGQHGNALPPGALKSDIELAFGITEEKLPAAIVKPGKYTKHVARWLEYGHRLVRGGYSKILPNGRVRGPGRAASISVQPYPFIRPAFETARVAATMAAVESLKRNLPTAVKTGTVPGSGVENG
jgi:HK97 gp10 family phage protein